MDKLNFLILLKNYKKSKTNFLYPVLGDIISNIHTDNSKFISEQDVFLSKNIDELESLQPDLLITCGRSFISKNLKLFLRKNPPKFHFHLQIADTLIDPFQTITHKIQVQPKYFFKKLFEDLDFDKFRAGEEDENNDYLDDWERINAKYSNKVQQFLRNAQFSDFHSHQFRAFYSA